MYFHNHYRRRVDQYRRRRSVDRSSRDPSVTSIHLKKKSNARPVQNYPRVVVNCDEKTKSAQRSDLSVLYRTVFANDTRRRRFRRRRRSVGEGGVSVLFFNRPDRRGVYRSIVMSRRCRRDVDDDGFEAAASMCGRRMWMRGRRARDGVMKIAVAVAVAVMMSVVVVDAQRFVAMKAPQVRSL